LSEKFNGRNISHRLQLSVLTEEDPMAKYGKKAQEEVEKTMHEHKHKGKFESREQAVAVGLSKARKKGAKVPKKKS
jgi:uncharacterized protein DUF6496